MRVSSMVFNQSDEHLLSSSAPRPCKKQTYLSSKRKYKPEIINFSENDGNPNDSKRKRVKHREIERQRRQEMATLHHSLRSLLPFEYLKGKRSMSDHMQETVKYIKYLQNRIQELRSKRDAYDLKSEEAESKEQISSREEENTVKVKICCIGVEVVINTSSGKGLSVSRVLRVLIKEGLHVVSCISTVVNQRLLLNIQSQVTEGRSIDPYEVQQKLTTLASS